MDKEKKYFKELRKKVDIYFVIIISILSSLSIFMVTELDDKIKGNLNFIIIIVSICLFLYLFSIRDNNESKNITEFDKILLSSTFSLFVLLVLLATKNYSNLIIPDFIIKEKTTLIIITLLRHLIVSSNFISTILFITISMVGYRSYSYNKINKLEKNIKKDKLEKNSQTNNKKMYTLEDLFYAKFKQNNIDKIVIKDSDDDIPDAFKIDRTKEELKIAINKYSTIGVVGEWGTGKSTLINSTIKELDKSDFIIIKDFDSWSIKSQDALILAMYNTITENLGENIGFFKRKKIQNALINISTNIPYIGKGIGSYFENRVDDYTEYKEIKADLEEKLENSDKRLIFIIDNLDRMNSDNVLFLLTLIETLFKLPSITFILAYDKNRLNDIFKDNLLDLRYLEKIINKEIFMPILDRDTLEECLENLLNIYNYNLQNPKVIKLICKRFTNIRQFIHFCNYLTKKPDFLNVFIKQKIESDYFIIQAIKYLDYNTYLNIYNDRESLVDIKHRTETISNKYKDYEDLMYLLFSESENRKYSILNPILYKLCYLPIESKTQRIKDCLDELLSNYKDFSQKTDELDNSNYEMYQKKAIIFYLKLTSHSSKYDIMYFFSFLEFEITFTLKEFKDKIVLWDLFNKCTSHNKNSLYNLIVSNKDIPKLSRYLDENIVSVLLAIFESFSENISYSKLSESIIKEYPKNQEEYCKKILMYEYNFNEIPNELLNSTINKMYSPILNDPIIIKDEEVFSKFYSYLTKRYDILNEITLNYIDKIFSKVVARGENLYEFISFFILKKDIFYSLESLVEAPDEILNEFQDEFFEKIIFTVTPENIHNLIKKFPPKDATEEKIKRDFEEKYPKK